MSLSTTRLAIIATGGCMLWFVCLLQLAGISFYLPYLAETEYKVHAAQAQWVAVAFNITWGSFAIASGRICDIHGLRTSAIASTAWAAIWLAASAFMPNIASLSIARALSGIGYAVACPAITGIIGSAFPAGRLRQVAFAALSGAAALGGGAAWIFAGLFANVKWNWRIYMGMCSLLLLISFAAAFAVPRDKPHPTDTRVDWIGAGLITSAQLSLALGLSMGTTYGWDSFVPALLAGSVILLVAFVFEQKRANRNGRAPLVPSRIVTGSHARHVWTVYIASVLIWTGIDNVMVTGVFYYAEVLNIEGLSAGVRFVPGAVGGLVASIVVALLVMRMHKGLLIAICCAIGSIAGVLMAYRPLDAPYWQYELWAWFTPAWATDGMMALGTIGLSECAEPEDQAVATSLQLASARLGSYVSLCLTTIIRDHFASTGDVRRGAFASFMFNSAAVWSAIPVVLIGFANLPWRNAQNSQTLAEPTPTLHGDQTSLAGIP